VTFNQHAERQAKAVVEAIRFEAPVGEPEQTRFIERLAQGER
jgi:hypothetical protein